VGPQAAIKPVTSTRLRGRRRGRARHARRHERARAAVRETSTSSFRVGLVMTRSCSPRTCERDLVRRFAMRGKARDVAAKHKKVRRCSGSGGARSPNHASISSNQHQAELNGGVDRPPARCGGGCRRDGESGGTAPRCRGTRSRAPAAEEPRGERGRRCPGDMRRQRRAPCQRWTIPAQRVGELPRERSG